MSESEKPNICFITTPGEITQSAGGFTNPLEVSPALQRVANIDTLNFSDQQISIAQLSREVAGAIHSRLSTYDGFVVTSDKIYLQYLAPRLAFILGPGLNRTVAVVATDFPASEPVSSASADLAKAAITASTPFNEVVILYGNSVIGGTNFLLANEEGSSVLIYTSYTHAYGNLGAVSGKGIEIYHLKDFQSEEDTFHDDLETNILPVSINPGFEPQFFIEGFLTSKGVVLELPGWTLPTREPYSLIQLIDELVRKHQIPVLVTGTGLAPEVGQTVAEALGAALGRNMNPEVARAKFSWVLGRVARELAEGKLEKKEKLPRVNDLMKRPYVGEFGIDKPFNDYKV